MLFRSPVCSECRTDLGERVPYPCETLQTLSALTGRSYESSAGLAATGAAVQHLSLRKDVWINRDENNAERVVAYSVVGLRPGDMALVHRSYGRNGWIVKLLRHPESHFVTLPETFPEAEMALPAVQRWAASAGK